MSTGTPKPEAQPLFHEEISAEMRVQPELEATLLRFWDMVRKSADVIVTLRQENASLQAKLQQSRQVAPEAAPAADVQEIRDALTEAEATVHSLREELAMVPALRVQVEEMQSLNLAMSQEIARLEKLDVLLEAQRENEQTLIDKLTSAQAELEEMRRVIDRTEDRVEVTSDVEAVTSDIEAVTSDELRVTSEAASKAEVEELTSQLVQMRVELESRTLALQELRVVMLTESMERQTPVHGEPHPDLEQVILEREALRARVDELDVVAQRYAEAQERISELEESHSELRAELERTMAVVNKYRAAGVAYLEDPSMEGQVPLFGMEARGKAITPYMTEEEATALADRIDQVAQKLAELL